MNESPEQSFQQIVAERATRISALPFVKVGRPQSLIRGTAFSLSEIWNSRRLIFLLTQRDIKARYKDSSLGLLWSFIRPLVQLGVYFFIIGQVLGAARGVPDFAIFVFIGITTFGLFSETISSASVSIISNGGLVKKIYTPREIYPLSAAGTALFNFFVQLLLLIAVVVVFAPTGFGPHLLLVPLSILNLFLFALALGLLLSAANVYLRDTQHLVEVALSLILWFSPIVYPFSFVANSGIPQILKDIYLANPITLSVMGMQRALWAAGSSPVRGVNQVWPENLDFLICISLLVMFVFLFVAQRIFSKVQGNFAQVL